MQYTCDDCAHQFSWGTNDAGVELSAQCPNCHGYHVQPYRSQPSPTQSDMTLRNVPDAGSHEDDPGGDPLEEGDFKNRQFRDESWGGGITGRHISLFETPEFETTDILAPQSLYRSTLEDESAHRANLQLPNGITDNLHAALGNLGAWVENPYENSQLRPYNEYWKAVRPSFMRPSSSIQIGVAEPTMAEIINHVAQTDDLTPLYEYRGRRSHVRVAGPGIALAPEALGVGAEAAGALGEAAPALADATAPLGDLAGAGGPAGMGGLTGDVAGGSSAGGVGGVMNKLRGIGSGASVADDALGLGNNNNQGGGGVPIHDTSFYARLASDEDDANPNAHDEIPKNEDGDHSQQDDGNNHEWQRDISVNGVGGSDHSPSFDPGGSAFQRFLMLLPLVKQFIDSGEDASGDPLIQGLHQSLESEIPGYLDHGDDAAGHQLLLVLSPENKASEAPESPAKAKPEANEPDHADENAGGKHESRVASVSGEAAEFLPSFVITPPFLRGAALPSELGPQSPEEELLQSQNWPQSGNELCPYCGHAGPVNLGLCGGCGRDVYDHPQNQQTAMEADPHPGLSFRGSTQGPSTPEQIQAVQKFLIEHAEELGLHGQELTDTVLSVPTDPLQFADVLAQIQGKEDPPVPEDAGMSAAPPMPAQEAAPPGATMPVPGMDMGGQMMAAVRRYAADNVADACPKCGSHTTGVLSEVDGTSRCHACHNIFKTKGLIPQSVNNGTVSAAYPSITWNVDKDLRKKADLSHGGPDISSDAGGGDTGVAQGVPAAEQHQPEDHRLEQDTGHTWTDREGDPLKVGQEYEMYTSHFDIPDLVRIEAVKPDSLVVTFVGEFGLEHSSEIDRDEAKIENYHFVPTEGDGELGPEDAESLEQNNDDNTGYTGPGQRDMSAPTGMLASVIASGVEHPSSGLSWLMEGVPKTAGANYTPYEQRQLIDEMGIARNAERLDLQGTHYVQDAEDDQFLFGI